MPTHIGAETDLRFVYCAGEEYCMLFATHYSSINFYIYLLKMICLFSCGMLNARRLDRNGQVKSTGIHS
jgi:hypothetical protein